MNIVKIYTQPKTNLLPGMIVHVVDVERCSELKKGKYVVFMHMRCTLNRAYLSCNKCTTNGDVVFIGTEEQYDRFIYEGRISTLHLKVLCGGGYYSIGVFPSKKGIALLLERLKRKWLKRWI